MTGEQRRVAITGLGLVTPLGNDAPTTWRRLLAGESGIAPIASFDASGFPVRIAAEVKGFEAERLVTERKLLKLANRYHRFALVAAEEALRDAGVSPSATDAARWGCVVGSGMMGVEFDEIRELHGRFAVDGRLDTAAMAAAKPPAANPIAFARSQTNTGLSLLLHRFGIRGYASTVHTACASGGQAVGMAMKLIRHGVADRVLAGGFDSMVNPVGLGAFCLLGALSTHTDHASRPFDRTRNGFVLGEGAGFLVLEEWNAAVQRGATIYAEMAGEGTSLSSYRITDSHPSGDGSIQAMRRALADANATAADVDYINAHGTSTPMNDRSECAAIRATFGEHAERVAVSSTKSLLGHLIAGAGAVEAALCTLVLRDETLPINAHLVEHDPDCDLRFVTELADRRQVRMVVSNSFGFGGSNSSLILRNVKEVSR